MSRKFHGATRGAKKAAKEAAKYEQEQKAARRAGQSLSLAQLRSQQKKQGSVGVVLKGFGTGASAGVSAPIGRRADAKTMNPSFGR